MGEPTTLNEMYKLLSADNKKQTAQLTEKIEQSEANVSRHLRKTNRKIVEIEQRNIFLERKIRRNNVLFFGYKVEDPKDLLKLTISKINELLATNIKEDNINNIYKVGKSDSAPTLIEFISYLKKAELFKDPEKLRALKNTPYAISNDLCEEDRRELKTLRKHQKKAHDENKPAKIKGLKLEIDNKLYTAKELEGHSESDIPTTSSETEESSEEESEEEEQNIEQRTSVDQDQNKNSKKRKQHKTPSPGGMKTRSNKKKKTIRKL
ncbi:unnamed protein product [Ceutorhynchus assimilis]|uniref:Uncharacterized protein n=1 Tax=Ceutorhynchus assimilis TaxID=467358 RepID=A0A9N9N279_9CUCU|nr:unnamed protein product [Ceutorhynchus assimilis]